MPSRRNHHRLGFTLLELLIVISITAVLLSLLLTTLGSARESANQTICVNHARQIGAAILIYSGENNGYAPACPTVNIWTSWIESLVNGGYITDTKIFQCPDDKGAVSKQNLTIHGTVTSTIVSYGINEYVTNPSWKDRYEKLAMAAKPNSEASYLRQFRNNY